MLEFEEYKARLNAAKPTLEVPKEIEELEAMSARDGFWNDVEKSQKVQKRLKTLKGKVESYEKLCASWDDMYTLCEMAIEEDDASMLEELQSEFAAFSETTCGPSATATRSRSWTISTATRPASRAPRS